MNNKEAFIIYKEMCRPILGLSDEELGKVFRWIIENRLDENEIKEPNGNLKIVIGFFKNQFRLDDTKYDEFVEKQRENGLKGGRPKQNPDKPKKPKPFLENPTKPKKPYNENENVNDNVKEKNKEKNLHKPNKNPVKGNEYDGVRTNNPEVLLTPTLVRKLKEKYPEIDVEYEMTIAYNWLVSKGKTYQNHEMFMNNWLLKKKKETQVSETSGYTKYDN